ncbi:Protein of unknown function [Leuconostoc citreum LBAE C11]|nr:Protein of unknown function [Leuconostoc citreum LBAE C11]
MTNEFANTYKLWHNYSLNMAQ